MKFLAFLSDSLRETIDKKSFWVLAVLSVFFILLCWSVSFTPVSPEESFQDLVKSFGMVQHFEGTGFTFRDFKRESLEFKVGEIRQLGPEAGFYRDGFEFVLGATPPELFQEAVVVETALRKGKIKSAQERPPGKDETGRYPEPAPEEQVRFLKKRLQENGFPLAEVERREPARFTVRVKPVLEQQVKGAHKMGLFFGLTSLHLRTMSVATMVWIIEEVLAEYVAGIVGVLLALIFTAFFIPSMLEKGNVEIILSKPIHRTVALLYKYLGGLLYVFFLSIILIGGSWLALSVRSGYWNNGYLWSIGVQTFTFAILYSVSVLFAVLWRSWIGSILMTAVTWMLSKLVGFVHQLLHTPPAISKVDSGWLTFSDVLHHIFPKTHYLGKLNDVLLMKGNIGETIPEESAKNFLPAGVTWELVILSSVAFVVVMLSLSCWRFAKKDY